MNQKKYYPTAVALYITYFILGIAVTIMGQYKQSFAAMWGANQLADGSFDVSKVMAIIAAVGLGRLIAFPFAGPFSDKYGRRLSALVGVVFFAIFFIGITFTHSTVLAYILMICSGMANSFLDTSITPSCMEIFKENGAIANLFTKFAISMAQFLLPFLITFVAARDMSFRTLYFLAAGIIIVDGIFLAILPFPPKEEAPKAADGTVEKRKMKLTPSAILLVCIGFTASTTFMLFMNCNQELGKLYGMTNPSMIQFLLFRGPHLRSPSDSGTDEKGFEAHPRSGYLSLCCFLRTAADVFRADSADLYDWWLLNRLLRSRRRIAAGNLYGE